MDDPFPHLINKLIRTFKKKLKMSVSLKQVEPTQTRTSFRVISGAKERGVTIATVIKLKPTILRRNKSKDAQAIV